MKKTKIIISVLTLITFFLLTFMGTSCKKESLNNNNDTTATNKDYVLVIKNGAQNITPDKHITYSAYLVDTDGNKTEPSSITWSGSNTNVATINNSGVLSDVGTGSITINASVTIGEQTYTASVPLGIYTPPTLFAVAPSAIIGMKEDFYVLITVFLSIGNEPAYTYTSSDESVAIVDNQGKVTLKGTGLCDISVKASTMQNSPFIVPVCVIEEPKIVLPVVRVELSPNSTDKFKGETAQFSAKAYNASNEVVSDASFNWSSLDENVAAVNETGLVTAVGLGNTYIQAITHGIIGQAEIFVMPDTIIVVEPFFVEISAGKTHQFTAKAYNAHNSTLYSDVTNFTWKIPTYGISVFDIATVDANGLVSVKSDASPGMISYVVANVTGNENLMGGAGFMASINTGGDCDCGTGNPDVASISVPSNSISLSINAGTSNVNATALDDSENEVSDAELVYCSDNSTVVAVDTDGTLIPSSAGTATITICSGTISTTVDVTVTM